MSKIKGIDVSKWEDSINWTKVKNDGVEFVLIRATYGKDSDDQKFENKNKRSGQ